MGPADIVLIIQAAKQVLDAVQEWRKKPEGAEAKVVEESEPAPMSAKVAALEARLEESDKVIARQAELIERLAEHLREVTEQNMRLTARVAAMTWATVGAVGIGIAALIVALVR